MHADALTPETAFAEVDRLCEVPLDALCDGVAAFADSLDLPAHVCDALDAAARHAVARPSAGWQLADGPRVAHTATLQRALYAPLNALVMAAFAEDAEFAADYEQEALDWSDAIVAEDWRWMDENHGVAFQMLTDQVASDDEVADIERNGRIEHRMRDGWASFETTVAGTRGGWSCVGSWPQVRQARSRERRSARRATARAGPDDPEPEPDVVLSAEAAA